MDIDQFVAKSIGRWRSQRSAHHLAFRHFEAVESVIDIISLDIQDERVIQLCQQHAVDPHYVASPFYMAWEGQSDWDEDAVSKGSTVLVPVPDKNDRRKGQLLREQGYAESGMAIGQYHFTEDNTFILITPYDQTSAEEKIWFGTDNLRFRVSLIKTANGQGVVTASFASEVRSTEDPP